MNYDVKVKLCIFDVLLDWFLFDNGFCFFGGVVYNGNKIDVIGKFKVNGIYIINGNVYIVL